jgi:tetratricopeptide (TPR) repeat protein
VSGYLGFRFLKSVAERFELLNAAKVEAKKVAEERVDQFLERSRTIDEALRQYENASQEKDKLAAAQKLIEAHNRFKDDRHVAIKLARDYRLRNQLASAIAILDETIEAIRQTGQKDAVSQKNLADLLYNRACYNCLSADKETQDSRKHFFKEKAYKDLRESADLSPDNGPEAARDNDFRLIHAEAEFQSITGASPSIPSIQPITPAASPTSTPSRAKEQPSNAPKQSRSERTGAEETSQAEGKLKESEETN